ncbi:MAG: CocE/NonD family hydrolase [Rhodospirillales bacterium]|nr:CocE/NonD family hydrolase [Rhodospirillales bacterium]
MDVVTQFPRRIRVIEHTWIPMSDGTRLAARIWLPTDAEQDPVPAILEYLPYRKVDSTRARDELTHPYYAGNGYACVRVDIRGSGESDGILKDEYLEGEQDDALEILAWIAAQPWCTGAIGMIGISWGGFNGLQVAARKPPELKAIVTIASTDDRYADDIHYMGGVMINDNLSWAATMFGMQTRPPHPAMVDDWRAQWLERLERNDPWIIKWLHHQRRDAQWQHGSVIENHGDIEAAVYAVGGWADGYSNAVPRMLAGLSCPKKGLVGPWAHKYPHFATPGPRIGFLQETLRWWDQWLKGIDTGIMNEPEYRVWMQESVSPATWRAEHPGRWVTEPSWPSPNIETRTLHLNSRGALSTESGDDGDAIIHTPMTMGQRQGEWFSYGLVPDAPADQREDDGCSIVFETEPLTEAVEIMGAPVLDLEVSADRPNAFLIARLCDVAPDGASTRVSYGALNLTHRDSHEHPEPLIPGKTYRVRLQLNDIAQHIPAGHRIRVALSNSLWPMFWPSPEPVTVLLRTGRSSLGLPLRDARAEDGALRQFGPPESSAPWETETLEPADYQRRVEHDDTTGQTRMTVVNDSGLTRDPETGWTFGSRVWQAFDIKENDPASAHMTVHWTHRFGSDEHDLDIRTETRSTLACSATDWLFWANCEAFEGDRRVFAKTWDSVIPRDLN